MAPVLLAGMLTLGHGNLERGYPLLLVAIFLAGIVQVVLAHFKLARFAAIFPAAVVEGMLCAIGLLIIVKQVPLMLGAKFEAHDFWAIVAEIPEHFADIQDHPQAFALGVFSLVLIFTRGTFKARWLKIVSPLVIVVFVGAVLGQVIGLDPMFLINVPMPFEHGVVFPQFADVLNDQSLWLSVLAIVLTLTMITAHILQKTADRFSTNCAPRERLDGATMFWSCSSVTRQNEARWSACQLQLVVCQGVSRSSVDFWPPLSFAGIKRRKR